MTQNIAQDSQKSKNEKFWDEKGQISQMKLHSFLEQTGFGTYYTKSTDHKTSNPLLIQVSDNIVSEVNENYMMNFVKDYIKKIISTDSEYENVLNSFYATLYKVNHKIFNLLNRIEIEFIKDSKEVAYLFFNNGVLEITRKDIKLISYNSIGKCVWKNEIIEAEFSLLEIGEIFKSDFFEFLKMITKVDNTAESGNRLNSIASIIGYLCHKYKNQIDAKAIILMDADSSNELEGRTGKTLVCTAISKVVDLSMIDGKSFNSSGNFKYSGLKLYTKVVLYDDVKKNFDFTSLYSTVTTGFEIEKKYKDKLFIPFEESPKIIITTNYSINGKGSSFDARVFEFEISNTFNANFKPIDIYSKRFFDDWNDLDWNKFYNLIAKSIQYYLKYGLVASKPINLNLSKLKDQTNAEFVEFCQNNISLRKYYDKSILYNSFLEKYTINRGTSQRGFTDWLKKWADSNNLLANEKHSGNTREIEFVEK